jgi:hypothetical protein
LFRKQDDICVLSPTPRKAVRIVRRARDSRKLGYILGIVTYPLPTPRNLAKSHPLLYLSFHCVKSGVWTS